jgi:hypothetical protein
MAIREGERVELVVEGAWFEKFSWSRQLLDPELTQARGAPAFAIACTVVKLGHLAGIVARTDGSWDGGGRKHEGFEILVPWSYVVAILEIGAESGGARRIGFL